MFRSLVKVLATPPRVFSSFLSPGVAPSGAFRCLQSAALQNARNSLMDTGLEGRRRRLLEMAFASPIVSLTRFISRKCALKPREIKKKKKTKEVYRSAWEGEASVPTFDGVIRYDMMYYESQPKDRVYQKTWVDCPEPVKKCKKICRGKGKPPVFEKREKGWKPKGCATLQHAKDGCPRFCSPGCKPARDPPSCFRFHKKSCEKIETPYPSFSECTKGCPRPIPNRECRCLDPLMMCEANLHLEEFLETLAKKNTCDKKGRK